MIKIKNRNGPSLKNFTAIFFLSLLFFGGCSEKISSRENKLKDSVVAVVNGEKIFSGSFKKELKLMKRKYRVQDHTSFKPNELLLLKTKSLNNLVQNLLFEQEASRRNIRVTNDEYQKALRMAKSGYSEDSFKQVFDMEDIDREEWRKKLKNSLLIKNLIRSQVNSKLSVTEEELAGYFKNHPKEFYKPSQVRALHIMLATEEEARNILKQLENPGTKFSNLAIEYSQGPEGPKGGDLGYLEAGQMPEEFDDIFKLEAGKISDVIQTPYGFHILRVVDKKPARMMSFEESKKRIQTKLLRQLQENAFQRWVKQIRKRSSIEINHENFAKIN